MTVCYEELVTIAGAKTRVLRGGRSGAPPVVLLHGGVPGRSLYCGGTHMWRPSLPLFAEDGHVVALDLPGSGGSEIAGPDEFTIDGMAGRVLGVLRALDLGACHVIGTDIGGLIALWLAMEVPDALASISIVASHVSTPTGDSQENIALAHPPRPLWSRASQAWALERMSWSHHHIDGALLDACVGSAEGTPHQAARRIVEEGGFDAFFLPSVGAAKGHFYRVARDRGLEVAVQIVWAEKDPLSRLENGMTLFRIIAEKQRLSQFQVLARVGALPFHEAPEALHAVVGAFHRGLSDAAA